MCFAITNPTFSELIFKGTTTTDGDNLPLPKEKHLTKDLGEDSFLTSPVSVVICDGIGGAPFSSAYISMLVAIYHQRAMLHAHYNGQLKSFDKPKFTEFGLQQAKNAILAYNNYVSNIFKKWVINNNLDMFIKPALLASSTTYISAVLNKLCEDTLISNFVPDSPESIQTRLFPLYPWLHNKRNAV